MRRGLEKIQTSPPLQFAEGESFTTALRRKFVVAAYLLRVTFTWSMTGGTGAGSIPGDALFRLIRRIVIGANGTDQQQYTGQFLYLWSKLFFPTGYVQTPPTSVAAGASQADREAWYELPFEMGHHIDPSAWGFPTQGLQSPELTVDWGAASDLAIGEDGTPGIASAAVELYERPFIDPVRPMDEFRPLFIQRVQVDIDQAGDKVIRLDKIRPGHQLRAVFIQAYQDGSGGADYVSSDDVVSTVRLVVGGKAVVERTAWAAHQQLNVVNYNLSATETGAIVLDAAEDELPGEFWRVTGAEPPYLELEVDVPSGDCRVVVHAVYTQPARRARR